MANTLKHRGPDADGFYLSGPVGLGHRRLKIIDLEAGIQPMFNEDRSLAIVFNGEIYNYRELRQQLLTYGHVFGSHSDTEVILHAYEQWGFDAASHLHGMFAFAIWDARKNLLFLARDRVGIKPLYYFWDQKHFLFASELKAILADPLVEKSIDYTAVDDYLTYLYIPAPKTIFQQIYKLLPGHYLVISRDGLIERQYWDLHFGSKNTKTEAEMAEELLTVLKKSVSSHLMSDVPLGAFLSGGIDSSAVVGLMAQSVADPVNTASIGFQESGFDELPYARLVAQKYSTRAHEQIVQADAAKILDDLIWHFDEPFADSSMVPTYYVSQVARQRVTVCLSGDGGDENFAGYRRYRYDYFENQVRARVPGWLRQPIFGLLGRIYPKADWLPQVFRAKTLFTNLSLSPERGYFNTMRWFNPAMKKVLYRRELRGILHDYDPFALVQGYFDRTRGWDPLARIQYVDIKTYLCDDILTKVDRASMAHSLEVRVPILDHQVIEHAATIPSAYKLKNGEGKHILKKALHGIVPDEILYRPKMGFSIPLANWLRGDLKPLFEAQVFAKNSFLDEIFELDAIRTWWAQHQRQTRDLSYFLWALLVLEYWGRRFIRT